jgi:hypothetical protein
VNGKARLCLQSTHPDRYSNRALANRTADPTLQQPAHASPGADREHRGVDPGIRLDESNPGGTDDNIIAGHARLLAVEKLAMKEVPVIVLRHLSAAQRRALVIADKQLAIEGAGWDEEMLRIELAILHEADYDLNLVGFDDIELQRLHDAQDAAEGLTEPAIFGQRLRHFSRNREHSTGFRSG